MNAPTTDRTDPAHEPHPAAAGDMVVNAIPLALYVHMPWCVKKCPYCDFNSHGLRGAAPP